MRIRLLLIILISFSSFALAQDFEIAATDPDKAFLEARTLAFATNYQDARIFLGVLLTNYPEYTDARILLAKTYSWEGQHDMARGYFDQLISAETRNREVWLAAIQNEVFAKNETVAFSKVNEALSHFPGDSEFIALKGRINEQIAAKSEAMHSEERALRRRQQETRIYSNNLGAFSEVRIFDQAFDAQYSLGLEYVRQGGYGRIIPRITFANRFNQDGIQYEVEAYPKFSRTSYAYLNYGFSDSPIFPNHRAGAEFYTMVSKSLEVSGGARYLDFRESLATTVTASLGLYKGNYYVSVRPLITPRSDNPTAYYGSVLVRKYGATADAWLGATLSAGVEPESQQVFLGNTLLSESTRYVEIQELLLEYQFTGKNRANLYRASAGFRHQEFLTEPGAYFWSFTAGIRYYSRF